MESLGPTSGNKVMFSGLFDENFKWVICGQAKLMQSTETAQNKHTCRQARTALSARKNPGTVLTIFRVHNKYGNGGTDQANQGEQPRYPPAAKANLCRKQERPCVQLVEAGKVPATVTILLPGGELDVLKRRISGNWAENTV